MTAMHKSPDFDTGAPQTPLLPFDPREVDRMGLRMTMADFARLMGCTRQSVSEWHKAGKISLGPDGRLDPRQAVAQLLRNSDPARVRSRVLEPLVRDLGAVQRQAADLAVQLARAKEASAFYEAATDELFRTLGALRGALDEEWDALIAVPPALARAALHEWSEAAIDSGGHPGYGLADQARLLSRSILGYDYTAPPPAADEEAREGDATLRASRESGGGGT